MSVQSRTVAEIISVAPATGRVIWRGFPGDIDAAVAAAGTAWPQWTRLPLTTRIETVRSFAALLRRDADALARTLAEETGRPLWDASAEIQKALDQSDMFVRALADRTPLRRLEQRSGFRGALRHKPLGVMAVITSFSQPFGSPLGHIVPALLSGNAVIFKPSEKAPLVGERIIAAMSAAGFPEGLVTLVQGGPDTGRSLAAHDGVNGVLFTGSSQAGIAINRLLSARPERLVALEMSGNNPVIAWDCGDIQAAAALIVQSAFLGSGQRCTAARRLIVSRRIADVLTGELKRLVERLIVGAPDADPMPFMGPVIDNDVADGLTESFVALMSHGGRPITHMRRPIPGKPFLTPGIIDVTAVDDRPDIELFGPLLQLIKMDDFDAAIDEANRTRFGLCAALIGGTAEQYDRFWANSRAGIVNWNASTHEVSFQAPIGGTGLSGNHRPGGYYAADHMAYPIASAEADSPKALITVGLRPDEVISGVAAA